MKSQLAFAPPTDTVQLRWTAIRRFVELWHGLALASLANSAPMMEDAERLAGRPLGAALSNWFSFAADLMAQGAFERVLRDKLVVERPPRHAALTFLLQAEGDVHWAVRDEDIGADDPPVVAYFLDYETNSLEQLDSKPLFAESVTAFVLGHMLSFVHPAGGSFGVEIEDAERCAEDLRGIFAVEREFFHLRIFESPGRFVAIGKSPYAFNDRSFMHGLWLSPRDQVPSAIGRHLRNGGWFTGRFADRS